MRLNSLVVSGRIREQLARPSPATERQRHCRADDTKQDFRICRYVSRTLRRRKFSRSLQYQSAFTFTSIKAAASARKRMSSSFRGWFWFIQRIALSYQVRACDLSPSCQWAMARKNQS